jgi:hypothetical protein
VLGHVHSYFLIDPAAASGTQSTQVSCRLAQFAQPKQYDSSVIAPAADIIT